jgi:uncharacterized membrane-anchored protein YjiN (DUF445 family)
MNATVKAAQLKAHKRLATGLFLLMLLVYAGMVWLSRAHPAGWIGYVQAFSEAAMVGALADWFAVTALFHHPLGIPIPHTNLIEQGRKAIGDNLGAFVVSNFLTAGNIRPYMQKLAVSAYAAQWLELPKNKALVVAETTRMLADILHKMDDRMVARFLARKGAELLNELKLHELVANALQYFLDKGEHEKLIGLAAGKVAGYIRGHEDIVREKVHSESYFFIPKFVDNKLSVKITNGLVGYFEEIASDPDHRIRAEISAQLYLFVEKLRTDSKWEGEMRRLSGSLLSPQRMEEYAAAAWQSLKATLRQELDSGNSALSKYISRTIGELAHSLKQDPVLQQKVDGWIRHTAYRYILRNTAQVGSLISNTIGNWQGNELSAKLELEVGKDLQFIRINGTIVGGSVGLLIYTLTEWLG